MIKPAEVHIHARPVLLSFAFHLGISPEQLPSRAIREREALQHGLTLVTVDDAVRAYPVPLLPTT